MDDYLDTRRTSRDLNALLGGRRPIIGKSNMSSLNHDLSPLPHVKVADMLGDSDDSTPNRCDSNDSDTNRKTNAAQVQSNASPPLVHAHAASSPPMRQDQHHHQYTSIGSDEDGQRDVPPVMRPFQTLHGSTVDSPLLASLEQGRQIALQLLENQTRAIGHPQHPRHAATEAGYGFAKTLQAGNHPITNRPVPNIVQWESHSPYASNANANAARNGIGNGSENKSSESQQEGSQWSYHSGVRTHSGYNPLLHSKSNRGDGRSSSSSSSLPLVPESQSHPVDEDHRLLLSNGQNSKAALNKTNAKDARLRDETHGRERVHSVPASASASPPGDKDHEQEFEKDKHAKDAPQNMYEGPRYHGDSPVVVAGENPLKKRGILWLNHLNVRQRCLLEGSQTLFKGELSVYLLNAKGEPFRDSPVSQFLLGAVGELTVTVANRALSLQDNRYANMFECIDEDEAQEWAEYLCVSPMANRPIFRNKGGGMHHVGNNMESHQMDHHTASASFPGSGFGSAAAPTHGGPPSAALTSPRRGGAFLKDSTVDATVPHVPKVAFGGTLKYEDREKHPGLGHGTGAEDDESTIVDVYNGEDSEVPAHDLTSIILDMESKIEQNVKSFEKKMSEKEEEMVRECKLMYKADKKKAKVDVTALRNKLANQPGATEEQRSKEDKKLQLWLEHKLIKIEAIANKRLASTEKQFDEFRHSEYERLSRINNKLKAKMKVLSERQERLKRARQVDNDNALLRPSNEAESPTDKNRVRVNKSVNGVKRRNPNPTSAKYRQQQSKVTDEEDEEEEDEDGEEEVDEPAGKYNPPLSGSQTTPMDNRNRRTHNNATMSAVQAAAAKHRQKGKTILDAEDDEEEEDEDGEEEVDEPAGKYNPPLSGSKSISSHAQAHASAVRQLPDIDDPILDTSKRNPILPSQRVSRESMFNKNGKEVSEGGAKKKVTINLGENTVQGERPASPPIPTHQEGGSRFSGEFKGSKGAKSRAGAGKSRNDYVIKAGSNVDEDDSKAIGASRWDDEIDAAEGTFNRNTHLLYSGSSLAAPQPDKKDNKFEQHKTRLSLGRRPPLGHEGAGAHGRKATAANGRNDLSFQTGGRDRSASHQQYHTDEDDDGPNPNAKPLTGVGMTKKPQVYVEPAGRRKGVAKLQAGDVAEKHGPGTGRPIAAFKGGDPRYSLSYDQKMNLRHNRKEYCDDMSQVLQRSWKACKAKRRANLLMGPLRAVRKAYNDSVTKIQTRIRCVLARQRLQRTLMSAYQRLQRRAMFSLISWLFVYIVRWKKARMRSEKFVQFVLRKTLVRRTDLIHKRRVEAANSHSHFQVKVAKVKDISSVPRGLTAELQKQAQIRAEQRMNIGSFASVVNGLGRAQQAVGRFMGRLFQVDMGKVEDYVEDHHSHVSRAKDRSTDLNSGYTMSYTGSVSIQDVRAAHMREGAITAFVKMKSEQKERLMSNSVMRHNMERHQAGAYDSDLEDD